MKTIIYSALSLLTVLIITTGCGSTGNTNRILPTATTIVCPLTVSGNHYQVVAQYYNKYFYMCYQDEIDTQLNPRCVLLQEINSADTQYSTSDGRACTFTIHQDNSITWP